MTSEVDKFLEDVSGDKPKADPFLADDSDPLKTKEEKDEEKAPVEDKKGDEEEKALPFHKDPKLQRYIEKEIGKRIGSVKPADPAPSSVTAEDELTETLIEIIGNDTPQKIAAVKKFRTQLGHLEERGAERALNQLKEQADAEQAEEVEARGQLVDGFTEIKDVFKVDIFSDTSEMTKRRNAFIDFIKLVAPKDENGDVVQYPDIVETYRAFDKTYQTSSNNDRAKDLASRSMRRSTDAGSTPTTGKTWKDIDRLFNKLST